MKFLKFLKKSEEGIALYLSILVLASVLSIGIGVTTLVITHVRMARDVGDYIPALTAADAGIEEALTRIRDNDDNFGNNCTSATACRINQKSIDDDDYGDEYMYRVQVYEGGNGHIGGPYAYTCPSEFNMCIKAWGTFRQTTRALEAAW